MQVKFKKLRPEAIIPAYIHEGDAGANLFSLEAKILQPGEHHSFPLGFAVQFPATHVALIMDRSSLSAKYGLTCLAGVLDSNYRGEWTVILLNTSDQPYEVKVGDKIAQVLFQPVEVVEFETVEELDSTTRAEGGFGSTGR